MLITRSLRSLAALSVAASVVVADAPPAPLELIGWRAVWSAPQEDWPRNIAVSDQALVMASPEGTVTVRYPRTGAIRRVIPTAAGPTATGTIGVWATAETLVVSGAAKDSTGLAMYGYDLASGSLLWRAPINSRQPDGADLGIRVTEHGVVVLRSEPEPRGLLSLDVRTGRVQAHASYPPGCDDVWAVATARSVMLMSRCAHGRVQLASVDPRTLTWNWTRPLGSLPTASDGSPPSWNIAVEEGIVHAVVQDEEFLISEDGRPLPASHLTGAAARWSRPLRTDAHPGSGDRPGFDWNGGWPLPGYLLSFDLNSGRLGAFPLDRPLTHVSGLVGTTSDLAFVHNDTQITAYRRVYGRPTGPVALGGIPLEAWPDACALLTPGDLRVLGDGYRTVPGTKALDDVTLPRPASCDWIPPRDDGVVVSVSVSWTSSSDAAARELFTTAIGQVKRAESFDYDPTTEGGGIFSYTMHGPAGTSGATLINVGPVIVRLTSSSRLAQRLLAPRVRDKLLARHPPEARVRPPRRAGGWTHPADTGVHTEPVVAGGAVYAGADDGIYALDAASGLLRWKSLTGTSFRSSPILIDGVLYAVNGHQIAAVDAATGRVRWRRGLGAHQITVAAGHVYAGVDGEEVVALDAASGEKRWRFRVPGTLGDQPQVAGGAVYVSGRDGAVSALDAASGTVRWRVRTGDGRDLVRLAPSDDAVYLATGKKVLALDPATGKTRWRAGLSDLIKYAPRVIGGTVYAGDAAGHTYALDAASGAERWRFTGAPSGSWDVTESRGLAYVGDARLHALDTTSGTERWSTPLDDGLTGGVTAHAGAVYAGDHGGTLHAMDAATGERRWSFQTGGRFQTRPVVAGDLVYSGSSNGNIYALRATDGSVS